MRYKLTDAANYAYQRQDKGIEPPAAATEAVAEADEGRQEQTWRIEDQLNESDGVAPMPSHDES